MERMREEKAITGYRGPDDVPEETPEESARRQLAEEGVPVEEAET